MDAVKAFNNELSSLYEARPPISKAKMTAITRTGIKAIKLYKHVVQSVEKFIQKCKPEYKVPGLYVIDSIVRQSRHQFTPEKDVFAPRFARNIQQTFLHLFSCPQEDKGKIVRVLNLWQKNQVFTPDVIQPLLDMASLANKDQLVVPPSSNGVQVPPTSTQPRTPTTKPSPVKDPSWLTSSVDLNSNTAQPVPTPTIGSKLQSSATVIDPNIMQQLQNLQNLLLDKQLEANSVQNKKDDTVKFDKKLLDFDYDEDDDEPPSPQQTPLTTQPLPSIDSLQTILSNPEVLRQLQTLQQQMSSRQQQAEMEDKMRRLQEMRHQEEEFDKHLAQTLPNLPFASECDFKPSSSTSVSDVLSPATLAAASQPQSLAHPDPISAFTTPITAPPVPFGVGIVDADERSAAADFDERNRGLTSGGVVPITSGNSDDSFWDSKHGITQTTSDGIEIIDLIRTDSPVKSPSTRSSRRRRSPSPRRSSRRSRTRSRSRSRRRRSRTRTRSRSRSRSKSREDRERERERRRRGLPPLKKNHLAVCSTTLWIGHLSKLVQQEELSDTFGEFGDIVSINLIPPRGCAFICMNRRQDASKALQQLKHFKLQGKAITIAWAPGKGMKDKEWKDYWEVEHGASYIPWHKMTIDTDLDMLEEGGVMDEESMPEFLKAKLKVVRHRDYGNKLQQSQQHMMKMSDDKDELSMSEQSSRNDMDLGNVPSNSAVPPAYIPLPDGSLGGAGGPPSGQPPPGMPPPMGLLPPFALPPRLLGPMGPMGPLSMGNVPLGVPPPLMMPPPPQQMVGRLPPPFNPPPQMGLMPPPGMGSADHIDKSKLSQIPPPPTPDTFPDLSSMVNPFGIPLPTLPNFSNANLMPQSQPPPTPHQPPPMAKVSTDSEINANEMKSKETKEFKPIMPLVLDSASLEHANEFSNSNQGDRNQLKDYDRLSSTTGGTSPGGTGNNSVLGKKDCDWRESSPRRRDRPDRLERGDREDKRRRRDSPPPRRDDRHSVDRRLGAVDDRRLDDRRGGTDRRGASSRWQNRQNKWQQDDDDRHDRRSESPYKDPFGGGRPDKDERPSLLPLPHPDHFHSGGPHHEQHSHFKHGSMSHHEQYQQGPSKGSLHHDQHYQHGSMAPPHEHYQPGQQKSHHDQHYQQQGAHDQHFQQGPLPPLHFRQHDQHDQHFQHSPPLGFGGGGRYPDSERDEMMAQLQNADYPPPRGYFNRGHARMPPSRNPRPLLRTPNGPMFGPRGGPPGPPPPLSMRGHRPGPPGNRMDGPSYMPPRGYAPGVRGRGGRFSGSSGRDEWEGPPRGPRRNWEDYPPSLLGPPGHMGHAGPPGHLGPPHGHGGPSGPPMHGNGPKSLLGPAPGSHAGSALLGSPGGHLRMPLTPNSMERRKSRWSSAPENKQEMEEEHSSSQVTETKSDILSEEEMSHNTNFSDTNTQSETGMIKSEPATSFESQDNFDEQKGPSFKVESHEPFDGESSVPAEKSFINEVAAPVARSSSFEIDKEVERTLTDEPLAHYDAPLELEPIKKESVSTEDELSHGTSHGRCYDNNMTQSPPSVAAFNDDNQAQNLYGDEELPITYTSTTPPTVKTMSPPHTSYDKDLEEPGNAESNSAVEMNLLGSNGNTSRCAPYEEQAADAPIFDIVNSSTEQNIEPCNTEEQQL